MEIEINEQGGVVPRNSSERNRAKLADLGTLPPGVMGSSCGNCRFMQLDLDKKELGHCSHKYVRQIVSVKMRCAYWDAEGFLRAAK